MVRKSLETWSATVGMGEHSYIHGLSGLLGVQYVGIESVWWAGGVPWRKSGWTTPCLWRVSLFTNLPHPLSCYLCTNTNVLIVLSPLPPFCTSLSLSLSLSLLPLFFSSPIVGCVNIGISREMPPLLSPYMHRTIYTRVLRSVDHLLYHT